jgi:hypothetical protein
MADERCKYFHTAAGEKYLCKAREEGIYHGHGDSNECISMNHLECVVFKTVLASLEKGKKNLNQEIEG